MKFEEITEENSFFKLYKLTRQIPASKDSIWVFVLSYILLFVFYWLSDSTMEQLTALVISTASFILSSSISLIGFIFAAYVVFANLADKELVGFMAVNKHPEFDMTFLKYGHCNFIKIMFDLIGIMLITFVMQTIFETPTSLLATSHFYAFIPVAVISLLKALILLIFMLCKSAIYNVYHSVMLSARWHAEANSTTN